MTRGTESDIRCTVSGSANLPPEISDRSLCDAISHAAAPVLAETGVSPGAVTVAIEVKSPSRMGAVVSLGKESSPQQQVASSDRPINSGAVKMLADALARELARMAK